MLIIMNVFRMRGWGTGREMNGSQCDDLCERSTDSEMRIRDGRWGARACVRCRRGLRRSLRKLRKGPETSRRRWWRSYSRSAALSRRAGRSGGPGEEGGASTGWGMGVQNEKEAASGLDRRNTFRDAAGLGPGYWLDRCMRRLQWRVRLCFLPQLVLNVSSANLHARGCLEGRRRDGRAGD